MALCGSQLAILTNIWYMNAMATDEADEYKQIFFSQKNYVKIRIIQLKTNKKVIKNLIEITIEHVPIEWCQLFEGK